MRSLLERIESKYLLDINTDCWLWQASKDSQGYGRIAIGNNKYKRAHRALYEITNGNISNGLVLDHLCKNPSCINPSHLEAVTQKENVRRGKLTKHICKHGNAMNGCKIECKKEYQNLWYQLKKVS